MLRFLVLCGLMVGLVLAVVAFLPQRQHAQEPYLVATIHPLYLLLRDLAPAERAVACIVPPGISPHVFSPKPSDAERCAGALLLLSVAASLDAWAGNLPVHNHIQAQSLLPTAQLIAAHDHPGHDHGDYDPHFWLDPQRVASLVPALASLLAAADPAYAAHYRARGKQLQAAYQEAAVALRERALPVRGMGVLQFHSSLAYFLERIQMKDAGVINPRVGTNPTPRYLEQLIQTSGSRALLAVCSEPQLPRRAAAHIANTVQVPLCIVDPLGADAENMFELWQHNLDALLAVYAASQKKNQAASVP